MGAEPVWVKVGSGRYLAIAVSVTFEVRHERRSPYMEYNYYFLHIQTLRGTWVMLREAGQFDKKAMTALRELRDDIVRQIDAAAISASASQSQELLPQTAG